MHSVKKKYNRKFLIRASLVTTYDKRKRKENPFTVKGDNKTALSGMVYLLMPSLSSNDFPGGSDGKVSVYDAGDPGSIPGLGRSLGEGNGNPLQYYCLENPMDRGAWWATVHGVPKSQTRPSDFTFTFEQQ